MRPLVDRGHAEISVRRQCELLGVNRSGLYYEPVGESKENLLLMRLLDEQYTQTPFYGSRKMTEWLATKGYEVNRKRVSRLMDLMRDRQIAAQHRNIELKRKMETPDHKTSALPQPSPGRKAFQTRDPDRSLAEIVSEPRPQGRGP